MGTFHYTATDEAARLIRGTLEAPDEKAVADRLRERGYYPIRIEREEMEPRSRLDPLIPLTRRPSRRDLLVFTQELSVLLEAGLEVDRSLAIVSELSENRRLQRVLRQVLADVQSGLSLADSLAKHPRIFSKLYVNMVKAGEAAGVLELVLGRLASFLERAKAIREEILSALLYPSLVVTVGIGAVVMLLTVVLPRFAVIFEEAEIPLPLPTRILLALSTFLVDYGWFLIGGFGLFSVGIRGYLQTEEGRALWDRLKLRLPLLGRLIQEVEVARFTRTLGTLLQSGVPILTALGIVRETIGNVAIARALPQVWEGVRRGEGIAGPLKACGVFPPLAVHMTKVGEETGRLEEMLLKVAEIYDGHVTASLKRLLSLLEPFLILSLGLLVGFIVLSMLLAIFSISELPF